MGTIRLNGMVNYHIADVLLILPTIRFDFDFVKARIKSQLSFGLRNYGVDPWIEWRTYLRSKIGSITNWFSIVDPLFVALVSLLWFENWTKQCSWHEHESPLRYCACLAVGWNVIFHVNRFVFVAGYSGDFERRCFLSCYQHMARFHRCSNPRLNLDSNQIFARFLFRPKINSHRNQLTLDELKKIDAMIKACCESLRIVMHLMLCHYHATIK